MAEHALNLLNRNSMGLSGINNVLSFDEEEIVLESAMGFLSVKGEGLHITLLNLDDSKVEIKGNVYSIEYRDTGTDMKSKGKNMLNRLFK